MQPLLLSSLPPRYAQFLNRTSHPNARDNRMVKFLHLSRLEEIAKTVESVISELDQAYEMDHEEGISGWSEGRT